MATAGKRPPYIEIPILNSEYAVRAFCGGAKSCLDVIRGCGYEVDEKEIDFSHFRGLCLTESGSHPFILLPSKPKSPAELGTLAHEAVHALFDVCRMSEVYNEEFAASSVGAIVRCSLEAWSSKTE